MTRALDPEVAQVIWEAVEPLLPPPDDTHPFGAHNPRISDEVCFRGILIRLVTGSSWVDVNGQFVLRVGGQWIRALVAR